MTAMVAERLFEGADWNFATLRRIHDACEQVALSELGLDVYPNQIEVITAEQMLDAYSSIGMPLMYRHWSFGKRLLQDEALYRRGARGLAYEIVINSNPCICYIMEENTMTMQTLVIAHAAFGHNHFFKNNHLFRQWTDASGIIDYLAFAKRFIADCEVQHGSAAVERIVAGESGFMTALRRTSSDPYAYEIVTVPLEKIANRVRHLDDAFIGDDGMSVTSAFREYMLPLLGENPFPTYGRFA